MIKLINEWCNDGRIIAEIYIFLGVDVRAINLLVWYIAAVPVIVYMVMCLF